MAVSYLISFQAIFLLLVLFSRLNMAAPIPSTLATNFSCSPDSPPSCGTYIAYFAQPPNSMNLGNISDLFGVSQALIAKSSSLVSRDTELVEQQLLLIPITCGCTGNRYFANVSYQVRYRDSFHYISTVTFQNLSNPQAIKDLNPGLNPLLLMYGADMIVPLFCKCPSKAHTERGIKYLITYVYQPEDGLLNVSAKFNATLVNIVTENKYQKFVTAVGLPLLIPVSKLPVFDQPKPPHLRNKWKDRRILIAIESSGGAVLLLLLVALLVYTHRLLKKRRRVSAAKSFEPKLTMTRDKLLSGVSEYLGKPIVFEIEIISEATMNFNEQCKIGGSLYRATIYGEVLAIKKTKEDITEELNILQKVNHVNLVNLMGISHDKEGNRFLVYEFAENGSLEKWLHSKSSAAASSSSSMAFLTWSQRIQIALDVANGLQYMHEHTQPSIVHWDIRTSNVLLDSKFKAKIANFSMARPVANSMMPKVDVFAFGVVLLELLSGKKAMQTKENGEVVLLWKDLRELLEVDEKREERLRKWMDPNLENFYPIDGALSLVALARACTQEKSLARPRMAEIVFNLSILAHSSSDAYHRSLTSGVQTDGIVQVVVPVKAR
uniref:LysM receptor n=1 Tax=Ceanothus thyrsiflorus TaxID=48245 RepID=A0A3Q8UAY7_CEATH|nr:LysM receptor [Ceanothus thyrsiflorus]